MRKSVVDEVLDSLDRSVEPRRLRRSPALKLVGAAALGAPVLTGLLQASTAHPGAAFPAPQPNNTYVVTTTSNSGAFAAGVGACATGGPCSLQQAVNQFDADPSGAFDTIIFGAAGTFTLTAPLVINNQFGDELSIEGNGTSSTTINVGGFGIVVGTFGVGAKLEGLAVTGGSGPSALTITGHAGVALIDSVLSANSESGGPGGGAVLNGSFLYAAGDTFSGNSASLGLGGGAILNEGLFFSANDTFSGNSASGGGDGGGALLSGDDVEAIWDTFSANSATAALGGAVSNSGTADFGASIFAGNSPSLADNSTPACTGVNDEGFNVSDDPSCVSSASSTVATDAQIGLGSLNPGNGGPTPTESIPQSSPAASIAVPSGACSSVPNLPGVTNSLGQGIDQRGFSRTTSNCSAGAYQVNGAPPFPTGGTGVAPSSPLSLTATDGPITLNWTAPASSGTSPVTSYEVFRFTPTTAATQIATVTAPATTYVDTNVTAGTTYSYYVEAVNAFGTSVPSNVVSITPTSGPGPSPTPPSSSCSGSTANAAFVCALYEDLLGRLADPGGLVTWQAALSSGESRSQVALAILSSQEYRTDLITAYYEKFLDRAPDPAGLSTWLFAFASGASDEQVIGSILATPEFWADAGSTPSGFVTGLYENLLGRSPDPVGLADWETFVEAPGTSPYCPPGQPYCVTGGWFTAALGIMSSQEYLSDLVTSYYQAYLGRQPDPAGLSTFVSQLAGGASDESVVAQILGSQEFYVDASSG